MNLLAIYICRLLRRRHRGSQDLERNSKNRIQERKTSRSQNVSSGNHSKMHFVTFCNNFKSIVNVILFLSMSTM